MSDSLRFHLERAQFGRRIHLHLATRVDDGGQMAEAQQISFRAIEANEVSGPPLLVLDLDQAQQLMDEMWNCGVRPTEGQGSAGQLAATQAHLKDMQGIVHGLLRKDGVESRP